MSQVRYNSITTFFSEQVKNTEFRAMVPKLGICTISMGWHASHTLERKIELQKMRV